MAIIKPTEKGKINLKYRGRQLVQLKFKGSFTREQIKETAKRYNEQLKKKGFNGMLMTTIKYPENSSSKGWRSGYFRNVGEDVILYDYSDSGDIDEEPDFFKEFRIYVAKNGDRVGGKDKYNDCLYNAIKDVLKKDLIFNSPEELKEFLKVARNDGVHIDKINQLEKKLEIRINITGDHIYSSVLKGHKEINLRLENGHYSLDKTKTYKTYGINNKEKKPLILDINNNVYDGENTWKITKEELKEFRKNFMQCEYVIIPIDQNKTLEETYNKFVEDADILKTETKGQINLYKTGCNTKTASKLFETYAKQYYAEEIKQDEAEFIQNASIASLIFAEKYEGPCYEYDIVSMYPSIMASSHMLFPLKRGKFEIITNEELKNKKYLSNGIYRCIISESEDYKINRLFRFNKKHYYTNYCLNRAKELNLNIEMIEDNKPNALIYYRDTLINGNLLFYKYVQILYSLKDKGIAKDRVKSILNILWGFLSRLDEKKKTIKEDDDEILDLPDNASITEIYPLNDNETYIKYIPDNKKYFETNYARIKPFLLAKGRYMISSMIEPHNKHVIRSHTDSILSKIPLTFPESKYTRGSIVLKRSSENVKIYNNIRMDWNDK
jgi:hypothetical protein